MTVFDKYLFVAEPKEEVDLEQLKAGSKTPPSSLRPCAGDAYLLFQVRAVGYFVTCLFKMSILYLIKVLSHFRIHIWFWNSLHIISCWNEIILSFWLNMNGWLVDDLECCCYSSFQDLCQLVNADQPFWLTGMTEMTRTFGLELVESVLTSYSSTFVLVGPVYLLTEPGLTYRVSPKKLWIIILRPFSLHLYS